MRPEFLRHTKDLFLEAGKNYLDQTKHNQNNFLALFFKKYFLWATWVSFLEFCTDFIKSFLNIAFSTSLFSLKKCYYNNTTVVLRCFIFCLMIYVHIMWLHVDHMNILQLKTQNLNFMDHAKIQ